MEKIATETIIHANGSKLAGQEPDRIEKLIEVLNKHDLDLRTFGCHGFVDFVEANGYSNQDYKEHTVSIHGNFTSISHVFNIEGTYKDLANVVRAIDENIANQCDRIQPRA